MGIVSAAKERDSERKGSEMPEKREILPKKHSFLLSFATLTRFLAALRWFSVSLLCARVLGDRRAIY